MEISGVILGILWAIMSLLVMTQYAAACKDLGWRDQILVGIIFVVGGPIFMAANVLESILDCILPAGWGDEQ